MAVTTDIGNLATSTRTNKQEVGRRLALWALAKIYGRDAGLLRPDLQVDGGRRRQDPAEVRLSRDGMKSSDGKPLSYFTIAGADHKFVPAEAADRRRRDRRLQRKVAKPAAVRFAWRETPCRTW